MPSTPRRLVFWTPELRLQAEAVVVTAPLNHFIILVLIPVLTYVFWWLGRHFPRSGIIYFGIGGVFLFCCLAGIPVYIMICRHELVTVFKLIYALCHRSILYLMIAVSLVPEVTLRFLIALFSRCVVIRPPRYRHVTNIDNDPTSQEIGLSHLCGRCQAIIGSSKILVGTRSLFTRPEEIHEHYTRVDLGRSAQQCHLCHFFAHSLGARLDIPSAADEKLRVQIQLVVSDVDSGKMFLRVLERGQQPSPALIIDEVHHAKLDEQVEPTIDTSQFQVLQKAKSWIHTCQQQHKLCQNPSLHASRLFQPSRLLELTDGEVPKVRLLCLDQKSTDTAEGSESLGYIALSHCWGGANVLKLSTDNIETLQHDVEFSQLPKNFQHAIQVSLALGCKHLWIDSLCIIQDSSDDWNHEAPRMGLLFANAVCTISATAASNPHQGFYTSTRFMNDCLLHQNDDFSLVARSWVRDESSLGMLFDERVDKAPVASRGWIFQEGVLSQRVLHFAEGIVLFECNTMRASAFHDVGVPYAKRSNVRIDGKLHSSAVLQRLQTEDKKFEYYDSIVTATIPGRRAGVRKHKSTVVSVERNDDYKTREAKVEELEGLSALLGMRGSFQLVMRSTGEHLAEKMEFHQSWYEMVEQYSKRNLFTNADRLMAVAGIADFVQSHTLSGRKFLAGLWSDTMAFNLLWMRDESSPVTERPARELPTWSWASVDGRIIHRLKESHSSGTSPGQSNSRGFNRKKSPKVEEVFRTKWTDLTALIDQETINASPILTHNDLIHHAALEVSCVLFRTTVVPVNFLFDVKVTTPVECLFVMPILSFSNIHVPPLNSSRQVHGIILQEALPGGPLPTYQRIGYFWSVEEQAVNRLTASKIPPRPIMIV